MKTETGEGLAGGGVGSGTIQRGAKCMDLGSDRLGLILGSASH